MMTMTDTTLAAASSIEAIRNLPRDVVGVKGLDLNDQAVLRISELSFLEELDLSGCETLTDRAVVELRKLTRLHTLDLSFCNLITDRSVIALAGLPALRWLSLNWCYGITDAALRELALCASLEALSLWGCEEVTDFGVEALSRLPRLKQLELPEFAEITDIGLNKLSVNAAGLEILRLDHLAQVSDAGVRSLHQLKQLSRLTVQGCKEVTEAGIATLQAMLPACQIAFIP
jgi:hypothetical protein